MHTLNEVKASSTQIDRSLQESTEVKRQLMLEYDQFKDICSHAARLFIGITQNYNLSVTVFTSLYEKSIKTNEVIQYSSIIYFDFSMDSCAIFNRISIQKQPMNIWFDLLIIC